MGVFRVEKTKNYTVMSNYHFKDKNLSWKAKGLLSTFLSLPEDWDYSIKGLEAMSSDGNKAVRSGLKELEENGYLTRKAIRDSKGVIRDWDYIIYENPLDNPDVQKGQVENEHVEKEHVEKDIQLNTNILNTKDNKKLKNKDKLDKDITFVNNKEKEISPETKMLITKQYITEEDTELAEYNNTIELALMDYKQDQVYRVIKYILEHIEGKIDNKLSYFTTALFRNLEKVDNQEKGYQGVKVPFYNWLAT